ncbi:protein misato homolog 1 isoform X1 [Takifugu rubripes]|uniref:Protein misato homolog 1 n=2 Tax=Takifugu rubripes TaxID=31033 RepID=H2TZZ6_TAKRU|nr:protein misato homolog 1 isoform X1 [Takifugu rubripes]
MSNPCREVITLQLGHYSNFVGAHWWNLQDATLSYDPDVLPGVSPEVDVPHSDVLFREGQTLGGHVTYTPRLIAMDVNGSLRTLRQEGCLYDPGGDISAVTWDGSLMIHKESPTAKNSFLEDLDNLETLAEADVNSSQPGYSGLGGVASATSQVSPIQKDYKLEGSVKVWSDFLRIHLHPRTVSVIHQYNHDGEAHRLRAFDQGEALLQGLLLEELEDKLHFFAEECDYLQGFQVLCDISDGFSGLGSKVTEMLQDSYSGKGILTWGLSPVSYSNSTPVKELCHQLNCTVGTVHLARNSSFFCPLSLRGSLSRKHSSPTTFPHLTYDPSLWYHSSAVLALALDALTLPYRMRNNSTPMYQVAETLAVSGRKVVAAYGAIPFPMMQGASLFDALSSCTDALPWKPLSTCPEATDGRCYGQLVTLKGFEGQRLTSSPAPGCVPPSPLHSGEDVLASYISSFYPSCPLALRLASAPSRLSPPFPQIFSESLDARGFLHSQQPPPNTAAPLVSSAPVLTSLQSGPALGSWLTELHRGISALDLRRLAPSYLSEISEYQETLEQLRVLAQCYRDDSSGAMCSSEEDDDD